MDVLAEIERVKKAIDKSNSEYLKRDYNKYLKRLKRQLLTDREV